MNENIDLTKILKDCPKGWKFYSSVYGEVEFENIVLKYFKYEYVDGVLSCAQPLLEEDPHPIKFNAQGVYGCVSGAGEHIKGKGECVLFPSKGQRDWNKFTAPWYKKEKFDPKTLKPFDRVLGRDRIGRTWKCNLFSYITENEPYPYECVENCYEHCIPYNDDTKHLVGTTDEPPEYYRFWEE